MRGMWSSGRRLLVANFLSSGALMATGDIAEQKLHQRHQHREHDWSRTGRMFVVGLAQGLPQHFFYLYLDKRLPGKTVSTVFKKIAVDQAIASPFCIVLFFCGAGTLEGRSLSECVGELKRKFLTVYITDWCVWPPTQFVNFYFLPTHYRVVYVNFLTMLYNVFLSHMKHEVS